VVTGERLLDGTDQLILPEGFGQELHRPSFNSADAHGNGPVPGDKNDRDL
jgi:hypothetical protein